MRRPLMFTIRSRFFALNCWSILNQLAQSSQRTQRNFGPKTVMAVVPSVPGHLVQSVLIKPFVTFTTLIVNFAEAFRHWFIFWSIRLKRCRSCHFVVPIFRPDAIRLAQAGRPGEHRFVELDTDRIAKQSQHLFGILQNIVRVNYWRHRGGVAVGSGLLARDIENFLLLDKTKIFQRRLGILLFILADYFSGIPDEKAIPNNDNPLSIDFRQ